MQGFLEQFYRTVQLLKAAFYKEVFVMSQFNKKIISTLSLVLFLGLCGINPNVLADEKEIQVKLQEIVEYLPVRVSLESFQPLYSKENGLELLDTYLEAVKFFRAPVEEGGTSLDTFNSMKLAWKVATMG